MKTNYLALSRSTSYSVVARMAYLRTLAAQSTAPSLQVGDWRAARDQCLHNWPDNYGGLSQGYNTENKGLSHKKKTPIWYAYNGEQFRNERDAHEVAPGAVAHSGWFADTDCEETIIGIVASLPHGRFISGYRQTMNDERVYLCKVYTHERDAALAGDRAAEVLAKAEFEYRDKIRESDNMRADIDIQIERIGECYELRNNPRFARMRAEITPLIESIRDKRADLESNYSDF